ncbi:binding-protein-dependent transport systems inner membrane component [Halanaerobium praevalens DSM 2228]|uniref:Binding-protein-dependent transport systems inner membrane component n=1 Tax=Halanaerobium praevalens (strain ATCC 33744 / DSM 2228 / GSL) TaxID=572479 RepID=E3DMN5_HALPG|nr:binding-protein-dependent transport systems inner membrane component [Halanaerobium praevalens DSM 2228]
MFAYIVKRILWLIPVVIGVSLILFGIMQLVPGNPAAIMLGTNATPAAIQALNEKFGFNEPFHVRYFLMLKNFLTGELDSIYYGDKVMNIVSSRLTATIELGLFSLIIAVLIAIPTGVIAAVKKNSLFDLFSMFIATIGISVPAFFTGIIFIYLFSVYFKILPSSGYGGRFWTVEGFRHLILPAFSLSTVMIASTSRLTRSSMLDIMKEDYLVTARSKGVKEKIIILKHAFRNALIPIITNIGNQLAMMFGGAVLIESVFAWPGVGRLAVKAVEFRDQPLVFGSILVLSMLYVLVNLLVDIIYVFINPRISYK